MTSPSGVMIVAGEASADMHGAELVRELLQYQPSMTVFGVGGRAMRAQRFEAVVDAEELSVAGLTEVVFSIPRLWGIMRRLVTLARERQPAVVVLIDLPDFNLRLAKRLKAAGVPTVYYISPQIWAWRQSRVNQIRKWIDKMLVILPFEQDFYQKHGVDVEFVGHPLVEELPKTIDQAKARSELGLGKEGGPVIALLPGSRQKEVTRHLPIMLQSIGLLRQEFKSATAVIPVASTISKDFVDQQVAQSGITAHVVDDQAIAAVTAADAVVVCSGTSTLQTALLARPMVVVYKVSWLTFVILRRLVKVAHIALVNLIAGRRLVPELVQADCTPKNVRRELVELLTNAQRRDQLTHQFQEIRQSLGQGGAARKVTRALIPYLEPGSSNSQRESTS